MSLNMRVIPNPGDGIVQAIADCVGKEIGLVKNCFDILNISITAMAGMVFGGENHRYWHRNGGGGDRSRTNDFNIQLFCQEKNGYTGGDAGKVIEV